MSSGSKALAATVLLALLAVPQVCAAQEAAGISGKSPGSLRIQVLGPDRDVLPVQALVRLHDPRRTYERWATTHDRGEAIFYGLYPGTYEVEVSAAGYRTSLARADIFGEPVQTTIQVQLSPDSGAEVYQPATERGVSEKARKESERALLMLQLDKLKDAEKHLRTALKLAPQSAQTNYLLGVVLLRDKRAAESQQFFLQAASLNVHHVQALTALGGLRLEQKDIPGAVKFLEQAIDAGPRQWRAHWLLANARLAEEKFEQAKSEAEQAIELSKDTAPYAHLVLGEALRALGQAQPAVEELRTFLQQAPTSADAPVVRQMIAELQERIADRADAGLQPVSVLRHAVRLPVAPMLPLMSPAWQPPGVDAVLPPVAPGVECPAARVLSGAGQRIQELVESLDRFSAADVQTHERLDELGKPLSRETRKSQYLVAISQAQRGWLGVQEFRTDLSGLGGFADRINTRGLLSLAFAFHPVMQTSYRFDCEGLGDWQGEPTWLVHFRQLAGEPRRLQSVDIDNNSHPVALKGRAWILAASFQVVHIEAEMVESMPQIELMSEHQVADYAPVPFKSKNLQLWLPRDTQIYLDFRGRRYHFREHFSNFKLFSVDAQQEVVLPPQMN